MTMYGGDDSGEHIVVVDNVCGGDEDGCKR